MQDELSIEKARVAILVEERNELLRKVFELEEQVRRLTPLAPDGADVCHIVTHVFIDGTCAMCGVPEPRPAGKA